MIVIFFFFFKQKTAYEMRISDWSSDVCSFRSAFGEGLRCDIPARDDRLCGPAADGAGEREPVRRRPWRAQRRAAQPAQRLPRPGLGDPCRHGRDRESVVSGKSVSVRVDLGGRRIITKKKSNKIKTNKRTT